MFLYCRVQSYRSQFQTYRSDTPLNSCASSECSDEDDNDLSPAVSHIIDNNNNNDDILYIYYYDRSVVLPLSSRSITAAVPRPMGISLLGGLIYFLGHYGNKFFMTILIADLIPFHLIQLLIMEP